MGPPKEVHHATDRTATGNSDYEIQGSLCQMAGALPGPEGSGVHERTFRRYVDRYEEDGLAGLTSCIS